MHATFRSSLAALLLCMLWSCGKEPDQPTVPEAGKRVFVVCEGAYGNGNSALTLHLPDSNTTVEDAFRAANGQELGDVFQSMLRLSSGAYLLCINNSDRIIRVDGSTLQQQASMTLRQPRYALELPDGRVVVTTMYSRKAYLINAAAMIVTDSILLPFENPEGLTFSAGRLWICPWDTACRSITAYDPATQEQTAYSLPGAAPQSVLSDRDGTLWILSGNNYKHVESWLTRMNPANGAILKQYRFGTADPLRPVLNPAKDSLYFIEVSYSGGAVNNGVYRMSIDAPALPTTPFIGAAGLQYFWGIGIDPSNGEIYVADPLGFTQRGRVTVYAADGTLRRSFNTGVGPGQFIF